MALSSAVIKHRPVLARLDTVGDGTGIKNIIQDYSGAPQLVSYRPGPDVKFQFSEFTVQYSDAGAFQQNVYASLPDPLTVGVIINQYARDGSIVNAFTDDDTVTRNDQWLQLGYSIEYVNWAGSNGNSLIVSILAVDFGSVFTIDGSKGEYMGVIVNDDFRAMTSQTFTLKGYARV